MIQASKGELPLRVRELAVVLGATFEGDGERVIAGVATLELAGATDLSFVGNRKAGGQARGQKLEQMEHWKGQQQRLPNGESCPAVWQRLSTLLTTLDWPEVKLDWPEAKLGVEREYPR